MQEALKLQLSYIPGEGEETCHKRAAPDLQTTNQKPGHQEMSSAT